MITTLIAVVFYAVFLILFKGDDDLTGLGIVMLAIALVRLM